MQSLTVRHVQWPAHAAGTWGIYGQQYNAAGAAVESEFLVNSTTAGDQKNPAMVMDGQGHLVVVWNGNGTGDTDGVFMQRYSVNTALERPPVGDAWEPPSLVSVLTDRLPSPNDRVEDEAGESHSDGDRNPAAPRDEASEHRHRPAVGLAINDLSHESLASADDDLGLLSGSAFRWWRN